MSVCVYLLILFYSLPVLLFLFAKCDCKLHSQPQKVSFENFPQKRNVVHKKGSYKWMQMALIWRWCWLVCPSPASRMSRSSWSCWNVKNPSWKWQDPIFKELNLLKSHNIHLLQLCQFMYSFCNFNLPSKFDNFFPSIIMVPIVAIPGMHFPSAYHTAEEISDNFLFSFKAYRS